MTCATQTERRRPSILSTSTMSLANTPHHSDQGIGGQFQQQTAGRQQQQQQACMSDLLEYSHWTLSPTIHRKKDLPPELHNVPVLKPVYKSPNHSMTSRPTEEKKHRAASEPPNSTVPESTCSRSLKSSKVPSTEGESPSEGSVTLPSVISSVLNTATTTSTNTNTTTTSHQDVTTDRCDGEPNATTSVVMDVPLHLEDHHHVGNSTSDTARKSLTGLEREGDQPTNSSDVQQGNHRTENTERRQQWIWLFSPDEHPDLIPEFFEYLWIYKQKNYWKPKSISILFSIWTCLVYQNIWNIRYGWMYDTNKQNLKKQYFIQFIKEKVFSFVN